MAQFLAGAWSYAWPQVPDTAALFQKARKDEISYEASIRTRAEFMVSKQTSQPCDEQVGRFCVIYDSSDEDLRPEPKGVIEARNNAIVSLQKALEAAPGRRATTFPLVRYLVQAKRPGEAVAAARRFAQADSSRDAHMLLGFALHADRQTEAALTEFKTWLNALPALEHDRAIDVKWLLGPGSRIPDQVPVIEWRYADALYLTPGNETEADHYARQALVRMLAQRPTVPNVDTWDDDMAELTVRFGAPVLTTRTFQGGSIGVATNFSEHWDPTEHTYFPPVLENALKMHARADTIWSVDSLTGYSGHAPPTIRVMRSLQHQAVAFPDNTLVFATAVRTDTATRANGLVGAIFLLDNALQIVSRVPATIVSTRDSATINLTLQLPPNAVYYSAEMYDTISRFAARARYRIEKPAAANQLALSGILLSEAFAPGQLPASRRDSLERPLTRPVVVTDGRFGVYTELTSKHDSLRTVSVEMELKGSERTTGVARLAGWIGKQLGIAQPRSPTKLGFTLQVESGTTPIAVTLEPGHLQPGRYLLILNVKDTDGGSGVVAEKEILISDTKSICGKACK